MYVQLGCVRANLNYPQIASKKMDTMGLEPMTFRMQSESAATAPHTL